jgi:hypothetical protein
MINIPSPITVSDSDWYQESTCIKFEVGTIGVTTTW